MTAAVEPIRSLASIPLHLIDFERNVRDELPDLDGLAASIRDLGVLQPITVQRRPGGRFAVVFGHRRVAASRLAGRTAIPALIVGDLHPTKRLARQVAENTGRAPMDPIEEARAFRRLRELDRTVDEIARLAGVSAATVYSRMSLLDLPPADQARLRSGALSIGDAQKVARLVRERRGGAVRHGKASGTFARGHRLAKHVERTCDHDDRHAYGGVGCGPCWEATIRADERGEIEPATDLDDVKVARAIGGGPSS